MNVTTNNTDTQPIPNGLTLYEQNLSYTITESSTFQTSSRLPQSSPKNKLSQDDIIEICILCFILVEHTIVFILAYRKKSPKKSLFDTNEHQHHQQQRSIILPSKSILYNCLHRNWICAYSFSNICLSLVYFITLILKPYHPTLLNPSFITFYSLPLTLVQQILINFSTFHLFIISISILQYFIHYYRLLKKTYSSNGYGGKHLLITKHTNVALILSGSLALIFAYNFIFYSPKYPQTISLLPLITLNMVLLPLLDFFIFIFIIISFIITLYKYKISIKHDLSFNNQQQQQQQHLTNNLRLIIKKNTCLKCYSKFLQQNPNLFQDHDLYTDLHSKFFSNNLISSTRPSLTLPDEKRKYSTTSYENIPMLDDGQTRSSASYPSQTTRNSLINKSSRSPQEFPVEQQPDLRRNSANEIFLKTTLLKLKHHRSLCHLCYRLLLIFLLKYVLFTFPHHFIHMIYHLKQFAEHILKYKFSNDKNKSQSSQNIASGILSEYTETTVTICRCLFLFARFGDSLLLTRLPNLIKKYFPCWCHFNSKLLRKQTTFQRPSDQILMKNTESSTNEPVSNLEISNTNDLPNQQEFQKRRKSSIKPTHRSKRRRFRLRFQFIPIWSNNRLKLFKENC